MVGQTDGRRECWRATVGRLKLGPPSLQLLLGVASCRGFIDCSVDFLAEGLDRVHRGAPFSWEEEEGIIEIASALLGESRTVGLRVSSGQ